MFRLAAAATNKPPQVQRLKQKLIEFPLPEDQGCWAGGSFPPVIQRPGVLSLGGSASSLQASTGRQRTGCGKLTPSGELQPRNDSAFLLAFHWQKLYLGPHLDTRMARKWNFFPDSFPTAACIRRATETLGDKPSM